MAKGRRNREARRRGEEVRRSKHHLVPKFYLNRFADDHECLAAIRRGSGAMHVASTEKLCAQVDFYAYINTEGERSGDLEAMLAKFEAEAAPAFDRIVADPQAMPSEEDQALLLNFIAFQIGRGRLFRHQYNALADWMQKLQLSFESKDREQARARMREFMGKEPTEQELDVWLNMLEHPNELVFEPHSNESLKAAFEVGAEALQHLAARSWIVLETADPVLVTSDEPVTLWNRPRPEDRWMGRGIANSDEIRLPLDPSHMLVLTLEPPQKLGPVPLEFASDINHLTTARAHEWVFAHPTNPERTNLAAWARAEPLRAVQVMAFGEEKIIEPRPPVARSVKGKERKSGS